MGDPTAGLQQELRGQLIRRGDRDYDSARALYNGMIDKRPRLIARCADVADVIAAVNFGREQGLLLAIRGGGHNGPGLGSCNDGLVIDLSMMKSVRVDPASRTVRVDPGCTSGDVDHATHAFGLAVPFGIVSTTGVAGLTLGGGTGYLTRKYGLTIDNLLEADVVLADGRFVTASRERASGSVLGAPRRRRQLRRRHELPVPGASGEHGLRAARSSGRPTHAKAVMRAYRDFLPSAPEELGAFVGLKTVPSTDPFPQDYWGKRACAVISSYNGRAADGEKAMAPLLEAVPPPIFNWMGAMPFPAIQALFDPFFPEGPAVVLEGRLREVAARRGDRYAHRAGGEGAERAVASCTSIRSTAPCTASPGTPPPGARATRRGRWSSPASIPIRSRPRR